MRFRCLGLFVLSAGLFALLGDLNTADAAAQAQKKNKKKVDSDPVTPGGDPYASVVSKPAAPAKPLPTVVAVPTSKDTAALARLIDAEINNKLAATKMVASGLCSDDEFLRRAYLDITGVIPSAEKAREFLDSKDGDKRAKLLDELLADANYGRRMANIWTAKLFPVDSANRFVLKEPFYKWFEAEFNKNVSWDKLVSAIITAEGDVADNPAVTYFLANRSIDKLNDTVGQHFMGIQIQCAQCHNHPFTAWKQVEYWGMATFFSKVKTDNPKNANKGGDNTKIGVTEGNVRSKGKDFFPESAKNVPAKFLGGDLPKLSPNEPYRPVLAKWLTASDNPYFARALVNRTWAHLFGRGFVHPVDDMLPENEPSHPALLDALSRHVATTGGFDIKYLIKAICLSDAYQRTSKPVPENKEDKVLVSHMTMKVMSPEELFDSLAEVTGAAKGGGGARPAKAPAAGKKGGPVGARAQFVNFFLAGAGTSSAVTFEAGIPQALRLMNSQIANNPNAVRAVIGNAVRPEDAIEKIYLTTLSRRPTSEEKAMLIEYVAKVGTPLTAYGDILWANLNSSEFTLVR